jgi:hypothetical protein
MKIVIIGSGWYGLHIASKLQYEHNVIILEKNNDIFAGSSYNNQNRLHLGFHYPRCYKTRQLCYNNFVKFISEYADVVDNIDKNYYAISNESNIDYDTYVHIYTYEQYQFTICENTLLTNTAENLIKVNEKLINHNNAKEHFKRLLTRATIMCNYAVYDVCELENNVIVNNDIECDILINCTYGQLKLFDDIRDYMYEYTISMVYEKIGEFDADCITIMDGSFPSLFLRDKQSNSYTLTHVAYTPMKKSINITDVIEYEPTQHEINSCIENMEREIHKYVPNFNKLFKYVSYFTSLKTKPIILGSVDNRCCNISSTDRIISINCGKITGIFDAEQYVNDHIETQIN